MIIKRKLANKWWLFWMLSVFFSYLNPIYGAFCVSLLLVTITNVAGIVILKVHFNEFKKKIEQKKISIKITKKITVNEIRFFKQMNFVLTGAVIFTFGVIFKESFVTVVNMAPFEIPVVHEIILKSYPLQGLCLILASICIIISSFLYFSYLNIKRDEFLSGDWNEE